MTGEQLIRAALAEGFAAAAVVPPQDLVFDPAFRPYCEENLCGKYGVNYSCPPDCGTPEQLRQKVLARPRALVLQTVWDIADWRDNAAVKQAKAAHNTATLRLVQRLRAGGCDGFPVGSSGCSLCSPCAITAGEPCRFPDLMYSCMSAYCIHVKALADRCGMDYTYTPGRLPLFGMYVCD